MFTEITDQPLPTSPKMAIRRMLDAGEIKWYRNELKSRLHRGETTKEIRNFMENEIDRLGAKPTRRSREAWMIADTMAWFD